MSQCLNVTTGDGTQPCPGTGSNGGLFCCSGVSGQCDCTDPDVVFRVSAITIATSIPTDYETPTSSVQSSTTSSTTPSSLSSSTTSSSSTASAAGSSAQGVDEVDVPGSGDNGLPSSARVGLGVGVSLAGLCALIAAFFLVRRRRAKARRSQVAVDQMYERMQSKSELDESGAWGKAMHRHRRRSCLIIPCSGGTTDSSLRHLRTIGAASIPMILLLD